MPYKILSDGPEPRFCCQDMNFLFKFMFQLLFLIWIQIGFFHSIQDFLCDLGILQIQDLFSPVLVLKRHCSMLFDSTFDIINADVTSNCSGRQII